MTPSDARQSYSKVIAQIAAERPHWVDNLWASGSRGASRLSGLRVEGQLEIGAQAARKVWPQLSDDALLGLAKTVQGFAKGTHHPGQVHRKHCDSGIES